MYHILEALARLMAPVMSFTADEIWWAMPAAATGARAESVMLETWYQGLTPLAEGETMGRTYWEQVRNVKNAVNKRIEEERNAGRIKGSLATEVKLYCDTGLKQALEALGDELRFVLITSAATVLPLTAAGSETALSGAMAGLKLSVAEAGHTKCDRCWHYRPDVGQHKDHPDLCSRCISNIEGAGEKRNFA
jgi:isoleucyl-tRNA synthetase